MFDIPCHFRIHLPPKVFIPSLSLEANIRDWKDLKKFLKVVRIRRCSGTSRKQCSETGKFYYNILFFFFTTSLILMSLDLWWCSAAMLFVREKKLS